MYTLHVTDKTAFLFENTRANVALEGLDVADAMHCAQVFGKSTFFL